MQKPTNKIFYLDGIRGVAAFMVVIHHFLLAFYPSYYTLDKQASHINNLDVQFGMSLFSVLANGDFCVCIFFVLSGYVLSRKYFLTNQLDVLISGAQRRFVRLYIPVATALFLRLCLCSCILYIIRLCLSFLIPNGGSWSSGAFLICGSGYASAWFIRPCFMAITLLLPACGRSL